MSALTKRVKTRFLSGAISLAALVLLSGGISQPAFCRGGGGVSGGGVHVSSGSYHSSGFHSSGFHGYGNGSGGGGFEIGFAIIGFVVLPLTLWLFLMGGNRAKLRPRATKLSWNGVDHESIKTSVEETYFKIQQAWTELDQSYCRNAVTDALFLKHKAKTDAMLVIEQRNVLQQIKLLNFVPVELSDCPTENGTVWIWLEGSMIDYTINTKSEAVISGSTTAASNFTELWKFVRQNGTWLLDEIRQTTNYAVTDQALELSQKS